MKLREPGQEDVVVGVEGVFVCVSLMSVCVSLMSVCVCVFDECVCVCYLSSRAESMVSKELSYRSRGRPLPEWAESSSSDTPKYRVLSWYRSTSYTHTHRHTHTHWSHAH